VRLLQHSGEGRTTLLTWPRARIIEAVISSPMWHTGDQMEMTWRVGDAAHLAPT